MDTNHIHRCKKILGIIMILLLFCGTIQINTSYASSNNSSISITGYIVGHPINSTRITSSDFFHDFALALADNPNEKDSSKITYVQIPNNLRHKWGLKSNPEKLGDYIKVSGYSDTYYGHVGVKKVFVIELVKEVENNTEAPIPNENSSSLDDTYYKSALGKDGSLLKSALHSIIKGHHQLTYGQVWDAIRETDEDPNNPNNVILIYTGRSQSKYSNGSSKNSWNREHVWAKSHGDFGIRPGPGTDLHHIRPADASVNSTRSNLDFDEGGKHHKEASECRYDSDSWEPRDEIKGDIARMLFYMAVRYEGDNGEIDLELNEKVNNGKSPFHGKLSKLLKWHREDPVDDWERNRNNIIFDKYQHNRNPFIDHPEWVEMIWGK